MKERKKKFQEFELQTPELVNLITTKLHDSNLREFTSSFLKKSAVIILLHEWNSQLHIIMTSRSSKLNNHKGEMSFPGGRFDRNLDKSLRDTAIRETVEEIGISDTSIKLLGQLNDLPTITGYLIKPFVGILSLDSSHTFKINHQEVEHLVKIPLNFLFTENLFTETPMKMFAAAVIPLLSFDYFDPHLEKKFHIWGASAHLLAEFLKKIFDIEVMSNNYRRPSLAELNEYFKKKLKGKNLPH